MAGFVDKFKKMWDPPADEYEYDEEYDYGDFEEQTEAPEFKRSSRSSRSSERDNLDSFNSDPFDMPLHQNKVVNIHATAKLQVVLFKPQRFDEETRSIADELMKTNTVVLNLEDTNKDMSRRIIDFLSGVAYANHGKIKRVSSSTFIIIPNNVDLMGDDLLDELENNGVYI
ncbi:MAG: cell division protein SepF [Oscillospiraceae bacterium]|jgi:cell division inhibitor SepF|nr:cell division protein SepF [Oscillospiraceae bacterium]